MRTVEYYVGEATEAFEKGFLSEAARKRALDSLNRAYDLITNVVHEAQLKVLHAFPRDERGWRIECPEERRVSDLYYNLPSGLHQVREKHFALYADHEVFTQVKDLVALRNQIKAADIIKVERDEDEALVAKREAVRKSIVEEMELRKSQYVNGLEVAKHFGGLHVSVNAHWVRGHKGTDFIRYFFYLNGKLTPLQIIIAIADTLKREEDAAK